jgi:hypothetical protein
LFFRDGIHQEMTVITEEAQILIPNAIVDLLRQGMVLRMMTFATNFAEAIEVSESSDFNDAVYRRYGYCKLTMCRFIPLL